MQAGNIDHADTAPDMIASVLTHFSQLTEPATLFPHQVEAVRFLLDRELKGAPAGGRREGSICADEVGVGKTIEAIALILSNPCGKTLIVMPSQLMDQWEKAFKKWAPNLKVYRAHGKGKLKSKEDTETPEFLEADVVITSYGMSFKKGGRGDDYRTPLHEVPWGRVILDEAHSIAAGTTRSRGRAAFGLASISRNTLALTATPIQNREKDIISLLKFIGVTESVYKSDKVRTLGQCLLRRTKDGLASAGAIQLKLPGVSREIVEVGWASDEENHFYHQVQGDVKKELTRMRKFNQINILEILELLCRLKQASVHPQMVIKSQMKKYPGLELPDWTGKCSKIEALLEDLATHQEDSVVFTEYTYEAEAIHKRCEEQGYDVHIFNGGTSRADRVQLLDGADVPNYNGRALAEINVMLGRKMGLPQGVFMKILQYLPPRVLVVNKKSCGVGLNLQRYSRLYELIPSWSPAEEEQMLGRAYRMGQTRPVVFKKLIMKDPTTMTIDNRILRLQNDKRELMAKLLDDESLKNNGILGKPIDMKLSMEDIMDLISE